MVDCEVTDISVGDIVEIITTNGLERLGYNPTALDAKPEFSQTDRTLFLVREVGYQAINNTNGEQELILTFLIMPVSAYQEHRYGRNRDASQYRVFRHNLNKLNKEEILTARKVLLDAADDEAKDVLKELLDD